MVTFVAVARIAVNTRLLLKDRLEGIGRFTHEVLRRMTAQHPEHEFIFLFDRKPDSMFLYGQNVTPVVIPPQARHPVLFKAWLDYSVARALKKRKADLFFSPDGFLALKTETPSIPVIHDLNFEHHREVLNGVNHRYYTRFFPRFAHKASHILTVSNFSAHDISQTYGIGAEKITVAYNGVGREFKPLEGERQTTRNRYAGGNDYFLFLGSLQPRKNLARLFQAYDRYRASHENAGEKLVVAGKVFDWHNTIDEAYQNMRFKGDVIFTNRVTDKELPGLIAGAFALTYTPLFEGFGLPVVEAFACGTPVITSNTTSMPEVAGDAALVVDPFQTGQIADAMARIAASSQLRKKLSHSGLERAKLFDWQNTTNTVWKVLKSQLDKT